MPPIKSPAREKLPPNYDRFISALRHVGYSFEEAVADIMDNSIDAKARNVCLRFVIRASNRVDLLVVDDGYGMDAATLREAMRFGTDLPRTSEKRLGLFGLGLKLASIAHADSVFVVSRRNRVQSGRAWTDEGLRAGFDCDLLDTAKMRAITCFAPDIWKSKSGTLVFWERLFRFEKKFSEPETLCEKLLKRLRNYLGLHLHRLLKNTAITIDILEEASGEVGPSRLVDVLDPFGNSGSGLKGFPKEMDPPRQWADRLDITAHVWPANSTGKNYKLPGGANKHQGLYFYRNDRLLSAGTWHGLREEEPHLSLARVAIDLHVDVERQAGVNVRKARVKLTPEMQTAINNARAADGTTFAQYVSRANSAYRRAEKKNPRSFPLVPDGGYPVRLTRMLSSLLDSRKTGHARTFDFEWNEFEGEEEKFFDIDRERRVIWINTAFRELFRSGERLSRNDGILVKTFLFVLLRGYLDAERLRATRQDELDQLNEILAAAAEADLRRRGL